LRTAGVWRARGGITYSSTPTKEIPMRIVWHDEEPTLRGQLLDATRDALVSYLIFYVLDRLTGAR
jgi:hypothetical protein